MLTTIIHIEELENPLDGNTVSMTQETVENEPTPAEQLFAITFNELADQALVRAGRHLGITTTIVRQD